ncbi:group II intron reverse transcriptase/maturase [Spirosoma utsteinense]|uniref:Group II intron reverse transcriptase/maturase n=1 Tax=Spirosoma utsteinense TaxID=2585773 RepID=A0ABR6WEW8_9BACT|nr:group II intron reverse transcriptase/maturase [Spirosoma utsteinense]MBC3795095.1 group II intron reverse transcriptase/maturase [Spirosoma utsteinense]
MNKELSSMHPKPEANRLIGPTDWHAIDWHKAFRLLKNLRSRIFRAAQEGDYKKVRSLQKLIRAAGRLRSYANRVTSVRRITQLNAGKNTPGVDQVVVRTARERQKLVEELRQHQPWTAKPTRRVYIPKANGKRRPLGIPVIKDRCLQTMVVQALEPEWEAKFEASSYGFRPGRSCHDAIERIFRYARPDSRRKWVVDADIKGAFDHIDHLFLLQRIGRFPAKRLLEQWLKAGYLEANVVYPTDSGTPQGGSCSPLLANIALHGLEQAMGMTYQYGGGRTQTCGPRRVVRYADDFLVFYSTQEDAQQAVLLLRDWLKERGLALSGEKTRIVHLTDGVDFLGFNVRQYPSRNTRTGLKTLIKPSRTTVQKIRDRLRAEWLGLKTQRVDVIVKRLNPIIRSWSNYFRTGVA